MPFYFFLAVCGWLLGIFLGMTPLYGWNNGWNDENTCSYELVISLEQHVYVQFFGVICLPLMLMLAIYMSIFVEVRRISRQIASLNVMAEGNHQSNMNCNSVSVYLTIFSPPPPPPIFLFFSLFFHMLRRADPDWPQKTDQDRFR